MITILQTVMLMLCFVYKTEMQMFHFYQRESKKWMDILWENDETFLCIFKHYLFWCTTIFNLCAFSVFTYHSITTASAFFSFFFLRSESLMLENCLSWRPLLLNNLDAMIAHLVCLNCVLQRKQYGIQKWLWHKRRKNNNWLLLLLRLWEEWCQVLPLLVMRACCMIEYLQPT